MQRCSIGDRLAFTEVYTFYAPKLYRFIYALTYQSKEETEEIVQDIFLSLWDKKEKLMMIRTLRQFIFQVARNRVMDWHRKNESREKYASFYHQTSSKQAETVADDILYHEYSEIAMEAIRKLSPRRRQIFSLRHDRDMTINEIAVELGISSQAVKKQLYEATEQVKDRLRKKGDWLLPLFILLFFRN